MSRQLFHFDAHRRARACAHTCLIWLSTNAPMLISEQLPSARPPHPRLTAQLAPCARTRAVHGSAACAQADAGLCSIPCSLVSSLNGAALVACTLRASKRRRRRNVCRLFGRTHTHKAAYTTKVQRSMSSILHARAGAFAPRASAQQTPGRPPPTCRHGRQAPRAHKALAQSRVHTRWPLNAAAPRMQKHAHIQATSTPRAGAPRALPAKGQAAPYLHSRDIATSSTAATLQPAALAAAAAATLALAPAGQSGGQSAPLTTPSPRSGWRRRRCASSLQCWRCRHSRQTQTQSCQAPARARRPS